MPGEIFVDLTYRGLEIGRRHKLCEVGPTTAYVEHPTPMPVGSKLALIADGGVEVEVEVVRVHEQVAGAERSPGMRVKAPVLVAAAASVWKTWITVDDPIVPEIPLVAPTMSRAPRLAELEKAEGSHPGMAVMAAKGRMSVMRPAVEVREASEGDGGGRDARTEQMPAVDIEAITATAKAEPGTPEPIEPEPTAKKKRAPRKRSPKKSGPP